MSSHGGRSKGEKGTRVSSKSKAGNNQEGRTKEPSKRSKKHKDKDHNRHHQERRQPQQQQDSQLIKLYGAIYTPLWGNYYHWAFATYHRRTGAWHVFQVVQDDPDGPYRAEMLAVDPLDSVRCLQPLTELGAMREGLWDTLQELIRDVPVGGEVYWNCQDYVLAIWEAALTGGIIDNETWSNGEASLIPYYGPDVGGQPVQGPSEEEAEEDDDQPDPRGPLSDEFVHDSDELLEAELDSEHGDASG